MRQEVMKISKLGIFFFFYIFIFFGIAAAQNPFLGIKLPNVRSSEKRFGLFILGDSLYDVGNNNYLNTTLDNLATFPPYGETFFSFPTGRFCDGRIIPDFLAEYAGKPFIKAYLDPKNNNYMNGVNFASGGAGALAETYQNKVIGLQTQITYFIEVVKSLRKEMGNERSQTFLSNSVFLFSFGANDYLYPFEYFSHDIMKTIEVQQQLVNMVVGNITIALEEVYKYGGRKFGFLEIGILGYLPSSRMKRSYQFFQEISSLEMIHNKVLLNALQKLATQLHGFKYAFADAQTLLVRRIQNPIKYGFKVVDTACCGSGEFRGNFSCGRYPPFTVCSNVNDYLFFESYHLTERAYEQLSKEIWNGGYEIVKPYNFKQLFQYGLTLESDSHKEM